MLEDVNRRTALKWAGVATASLAGSTLMPSLPAGAATTATAAKGTSSALKPTATAAVRSAAPVVFKTQPSGTYAGMPLFDGNPAHLDAYLDTLVGYVDFHGVVRWANGMRQDYTITSGPNAGKVVPGAELFDEGLQGISTDFPAPLGMSQSWNDILIGQIGEVIGNEHLYRQNYLGSISTFNAMVSAAIHDIRINPLNGRNDEGFGEDPRLSSNMVDSMSRAISGINAPGNTSGFWTKNMVDSKHYAAYIAEWFRFPGNRDVPQRALMEYYTLPVRASLRSGAVGALITSYGRTNGVPNTLSPLIKYAQQLSPWGRDGGLYTVPDNGADRRLPQQDSFSNGFDNGYTPSLDTASAIMMLAEQGSVAVNTNDDVLNQALLTQVRNGTYGVTVADVTKVARSQMVPLVRQGLFNERDAKGYPMNYPFLSTSAASPTPIDSSVLAHQHVAVAAARESLVLLKNQGNLLPLKSGSELAVVGPMSNARFLTPGAVATAALPDAGLTPVQGIAAVFGTDVSTATDGNVIAIKSVANGSYLTHGAATAPTITADAPTVATAATFESFDWGQSAFGFQSQVNALWLQYVGPQQSFPGGPPVTPGPIGVFVSGATAFGTKATTMPNQIRVQRNADKSVSFVVDSYTSSFLGGFETRYYTNGRYLTVDPTTGVVGVTAVFGNAGNAKALNTEATKFVLETVKPIGAQAANFKSQGRDYAVVVVGSPARNSQGEGADRSDLHLGADQYTLIDTVAKAYPKRTIVVVNAEAPVILDQVQNNKNVGAIVYTPYSGQYGNYVLGELLAGRCTPTGRLTQTWYASMSALPPLDAYSIPEGQDAVVTLATLDPRYTVDMSNGDPVDTGLTYMYTKAPVTYPFGYGLSYSRFTYRNLRIRPDRNGAFKVTIDVCNDGHVDTADVVQLYSSNPNSSYGSAAPVRQLLAYAKVSVPAGHTKAVTLTVNADHLAVWNTHTDRMAVEPGIYRFAVGSSSASTTLTKKVAVHASRFTVLNTHSGAVNVFDRSFAAHRVTYRESAKKNTVDGLRTDKLVDGYSATMSKAAGAWTAISDIDLSRSTQITLAVGAKAASGAIEVRLDSPTGTKIAQINVTDTGESDYVIPGATAAGDIPMKEMAYQKLTATFTQKVSGVHDLYLVFKAPNLRVRTLQLGGKKH